eukprot:1159093-Pelagomonas_calceolata.AAC.5
MGAFLEGASCMDALEKQKDAVQKVLEPAGAAAGAEAACSAVHVLAVVYKSVMGHMSGSARNLKNQGASEKPLS